MAKLGVGLEYDLGFEKYESRKLWCNFLVQRILNKKISMTTNKKWYACRERVVEFAVFMRLFYALLQKHARIYLYAIHLSLRNALLCNPLNGTNVHML